MKTNDEIKRELAQLTDEKAIMEYWQALLEEFDKEEHLNDKKHTRRERRHDYDITNMDVKQKRDPDDPDDLGIPMPTMLVNLCKPNDWNEILFSKSSKEWTELISDRTLYRIINNLKPAQKEVLYYRIFKGYSSTTIAEIKGTSDRNIRKLYEKAITHIQEDYLPIIKHKRKFETDKQHKEIARKRDIYTISSERRYMEKCRQEEEQKKLLDNAG